MKQNDELKHYGVLGMKWGRRRAKTTTQKQKELKKKYKEAKKQATGKREKSVLKTKYNKDIEATYNKSYSKIDRMVDNTILGKKSVNRINDRMSKGQSYGVARKREVASQIIKGYAAMAALTAAKHITINSLRKYATIKNVQRANAGLARIGTTKLKHVGQNVYERVWNY